MNCKLNNCEQKRISRPCEPPCRAGNTPGVAHNGGTGTRAPTAVPVQGLVGRHCQAHNIQSSDNHQLSVTSRVSYLPTLPLVNHSTRFFEQNSPEEYYYS